MTHPPRSTPAPTGVLTLEAYEAGVIANDRSVLARAITLVESTHPDHRAIANALVGRIHARTGGSSRIGVTGTPGVGKSTLIETWGSALLAEGRKLAVLAVDPSSVVTGGSILGDKTRMRALARDTHAFVRPSPSGGIAGGVGPATREAVLLCEAAGYDVVLVETVGVGQTETDVAGLVDVLVLLVQPASGDELQGIKRGILELADLVVVNKADGPLDAAAQRTRRELESALRLLRGGAGHAPEVLAASATAGTGLDALSSGVRRFLENARQSGAFEARRRAQRKQWMWALIETDLVRSFRDDPGVRAFLEKAEVEVAGGSMSPVDAAAAALRLVRR